MKLEFVLKDLDAIVEKFSYGILPYAGDLEEWKATKSEANTNPHRYSVIMYQITIEV